MKETLLRPGVNKLGGGVIAIVKIKRPFEGVIPGDTAMHEAAHVVPAILNRTGVRRASRIPGPGYLGITEPYGFDAVAAMGPDSLGHSGTGHDRRIVALHGHDLGTAASVARRMLSDNWEGLHAVARAIEANREISGFEAEEVMKQAANPEAEIEITDPLGNITTFVSRDKLNARRAIVFELEEAA